MKVRCNLQRTFLLFIIRFIAAGRKNMAAGAKLIAGQSDGLADGATHLHKNFYIFAALWAFDFRQPGRTLSLLTTVY